MFLYLFLKFLHVLTVQQIGYLYVLDINNIFNFIKNKF